MNPITAFRAWLRRHPRGAGIGLLAASGLLVLTTAIVVIAQLQTREAAGLDVTPSPSPSASTEASQAASASPSASPSEPAWHGYQLTDIGTPLFNSIWARVTVDELNVRAKPGTDARVVGLLRRGDILQVTGDEMPASGRSWMPIVADGVAGWVATGDEETGYLQPVATPWLFGPQRALQLVASGDRVLAYGYASDLQVQPYEGSGQSPLAYLSSAGGAWHEVDGPVSPVVTAAGGNGGFVIATRPSYLEPNWVQLSADGQAWGEPIMIDFEPAAAAWGPNGPIVIGYHHENGATAVRVSLDGSTARVNLPDVDGNPSEIEASGQGYLAFERGGQMVLLVSADGSSWGHSQAPDAEPGTELLRDVELVGNQLIVVTTSTETGRTRLHYGRLAANGSVTWAASPTSPFGSATVDSISAGGGSMLALGWDPDELLPRVWRSEDGRTWSDLGVPANTFGGAIGPEPVWADGRWMVMTDAAYASRDGASWDEVFRAPVPDVPGPGCPPADAVTALDLLFLGPEAADCYGDTALTVRVWSPLVEGLGGCCPQLGKPEWLAAWIPPAFVSPGQGGFSGSFGAYPAPDAEGAFVTEEWARITGHFNDPAAAECHHVPLLYIPHRLESAADDAATCERRFVVTRIVPAEAP